MKRLSCVLSAIACATMCAGAPAQSFPTKPVRIIVAFPPGGGVDIVARIVGPRLAEISGRSCVLKR